MKRIRKKKETDNTEEVVSKLPNIDDTPIEIEDMADVNSIEEFLELKKLQNRVLGKMLDKMNTSETTNKNSNN
jgi:hypothetical protein